MDSFVYCWTDHLNQKLYVGSHKGHPHDGYVSSSKPFMEQYKQRPNDFTRQIIAQGDVKDIRKLEAVLLTTLNAAADESFYNEHNNNGRWLYKPRTEKTRQKVSKALKGRKKTEQHKAKIQASSKGKHAYLRKYSQRLDPNTQIKWQESMAKRDLFKERDHLRGKPRSSADRQKISEACKLAWIKRKERMIHAN